MASGRVLELAFSQFYQRFCATSLTATNGSTYATSGTSTAAPSGNNVIVCGDVGMGVIPNSFILKPFGNGSNGATFVMDIIGWKPIRDLSGTLSTLYAYERLYRITGTLATSFSNTVGSSSAVLATTDYFCSAIAMSSGYGVENVDYYFQGQPQSMFADTKSSQWLQFEWVSGTMTSVNALIQLV